jgi:kynureninase
MTEHADAERLDQDDPLRDFYDRFHVAQDGVIYLDGNSLGRLPKQTQQRLTQLVNEQWGERLIRGWNDGWIELPTRVGDLLGENLLGAAPGQTLMADSTTVCFYKLASAALAARPGRREIVTDRDNFPTDRYVLEGLARQHGLTIRWINADPASGPEPELIQEHVNEHTALISFSHVNYRSAFILDMAEITRVAHEHGALALWDLSHSAGVIPVELDQTGADLAVGCTYKYLNGGPGAPAYMYVRAEHQPHLHQPIWGWLGRHDPFEMAQGYIPGEGIMSFLSGTPSVLGLVAAQSGIELSIEAGIDRIRDKAAKLSDFAIGLIDEQLTEHGCGVGSPRNQAKRGGHVALTHPEARSLAQDLIAQGVIVDFRTPDVIRLGLSPLTTRYVDVYDGLGKLRMLLRKRP